MTLYQKIEEMLHEHARSGEDSKVKFWKLKAEVMEDVKSLQKVAYDALRFGRHFPDCKWFESLVAKSTDINCTCGYLAWRDARDVALGER